MREVGKSRGLFAVLGALLIGSGASAQDGTSDQRKELEEIIVTAQYREESYQTVPLAISAFDQSFLNTTKLDDIKDLTLFTPGFSGNSKDSFIDTVAIRGIVSNASSLGGDPSLGVFKNGVHQGRTGTAVTTLFDLERAEVIRGPQGFLFGRNAISGAISLTTRKPSTDAVGGYILGGLAQHGRTEFEGAINIPFGDGWATRFSAYLIDNEGYVDNVFTPGVDDKLIAQEKSAVRASLSKQTERADFLVVAEYEDRKQTGTLYRGSRNDTDWFALFEGILGQPVPMSGGPDEIDSDFLDPRDDGDIFNLSAHIDYDLNSARFSSITAYRTHNYYYSEDYDRTPIPIGNYLQEQEGDYFSQEFRVQSTGDGPLTWIGGISSYWETVDAEYFNEIGEFETCRVYGYASCDDLTQDFYGISYVPSPDGLLHESNRGSTSNNGFSIFGEINYDIGESWVVGVGIRHSEDTKNFALSIPATASTLGDIWNMGFATNGYLRDKGTWSDTTPRFFARFMPTDNWTLYFSATQGYKAGGYGTWSVIADAPIPFAGVAPPGTKPDAYDPESITSYEFGAKGSFLDNRAHLDVVSFFYDYEDLQTVVFAPTVQIVNVGQVDGHGVEANLRMLVTERLDIYANVAYNKTEQAGLRDCISDCGGLRHPVWSSSGVISYHVPIGRGEVSVMGEWVYQGERDEEFDDPGITTQESYTVAALRVRYASDKNWTATLYAENLFDKFYYDNSLIGSFLFPAGYFGPNEPRTIGLDFEMQWGGG